MDFVGYQILMEIPCRIVIGQKINTKCLGHLFCWVVVLAAGWQGSGMALIFKGNGAS